MIAGIVLCGGRSRRMGKPKAWLPFGQELLLQRVVRILSESADPVLVVAAHGQELPDLPSSIAIVRDPVADLGPLQGLAVGMAALPPEVELAYLTATDTPFLQPGWVSLLTEAIGDADIALPVVGGYPQPLAAVYRCRAILPAALSLLGEGRLRLLDLVDRVRSVRVVEGSLLEVDPELATIRNLNTPEDYEQAIKTMGSFSHDPPRHEYPRVSDA